MQRKGKVVFTAMAVVFYLGVNVTFAQMDVNQAALRDRQFLQDASFSSAWLLHLGEIAIRQAASSDVKELSKMMIRDQGQIDGELKSLAKRKGVMLQEDIDLARRNTTAFLSQEYGAAFDRNYISLIADVHQRDAALLADRLVPATGHPRCAGHSLLGLPPARRRAPSPRSEARADTL